MPSTFLALVVPPLDGRILAADLAGKAAGDYLIDCLANPAVARQTIAATDGAASLTAPEMAGDVLIIDARAWVSEGALVQAASRAISEQRSVCLLAAHAGVGKPIGDACRMLAIWLPVGAGHARASLKESDLNGRALAALLASGNVADACTPLEPDSNERVRCLDSMTQLAEAEQEVLLARAKDALDRGVRLRDPRHVYLRGRLTCGEDVEIDVGVVVEGEVILGAGVRVGAHAFLRDATIGERTQIRPFSMVEKATIGEASQVGPFARIRPGTAVGSRVQVGNYVEIKGSHVGDGSRINHHSFIGDADLGADTTIGAGTITCNHDGVGVARTIIERGAYIGSGCRLVAPIRVGHDATVGAGSTITRDVPSSKLTLARARQITIEDWRGPRSRRSSE